MEVQMPNAQSNALSCLQLLTETLAKDLTEALWCLSACKNELN